MAKSVLKERGLKKIRLGIEGKVFSIHFLKKIFLNGSAYVIRIYVGKPSQTVTG